MTNNQTNQPFQPFHVQSSLLQNEAQQSGKAQQGSGGPGKPGGPGSNVPFGSWGPSEARWLLMAVFAAIYWAAEQDVLLRPMTILVLLGCLLFRMERRARELAGVPIALAAIKLVYQMSPHAGATPGMLSLMSDQTKASITGLPWVPMFLAMCIFYLPQKATVTGTVVRFGAIALLISGLIPGDGYVVVLAMIQYTLFIGVLVGLISDHAWNGGAPDTSRAMPPVHA